MLRLFKYLKAKDYLALVVAIILIVFGVMLDLKLPDYMSDLTKLFYSPNYQLSDVALPGIKMLLCAVGSGIISAIVGFLSAVVLRCPRSGAGRFDSGRDIVKNGME